MQTRGSEGRRHNLQHYLLAGVLIAIPLWVTWLVFRFVLARLSDLGMPWVRALAETMQHTTPTLAHRLLEPWFQSTLAVLLTLLAFYLLGWLATHVIGRRLIALLEQMIARIPLVHTVYGASKKLITALQQKPEQVQRVVLIEFPTPEMKTVGFVTRELRDKETGLALVAVYVPTTPNPTSGYLEIVPLERVVSTDWSMDEAMSFIISGGAVAPEEIHYSRGVGPAEGKQEG